MRQNMISANILYARTPHLVTEMLCICMHVNSFNTARIDSSCLAFALLFTTALWHCVPELGFHRGNLHARGSAQQPASAPLNTLFHAFPLQWCRPRHVM